MKRGTVLLLAVLMCLALLAACSKTDDGTSDEAKPTVTQEKEQPPIAGKSGIYTESKTGAGSVEITAGDSGKAYIVVRWNNSANESVAWNMSGEYNTKKNTISYADCLKTVTTADGSGKSLATVAYRDGKGAFRFEDDGLHWNDEEEHFADGLVFVRVK
ncbi:MAG: hypothetical protein IJU56_01890 [Clostridia bacterium]|nr:hypothetical protein [Clostridia bacterium]